MLKRKKLTPAETPASAPAAPDPKLAKFMQRHDENDEEQEQEQPRKGSLDHVMKNVSLSGDAKDVPTGTHEAIITEFVLQQPDSKGRSARIKFELCDPEFPSGRNELVTWFKLLEDDLITEVTGGVKALKMALARLGYDEPESEKELVRDLQKISKEQPGVVIKVSYDGQWRRIRIEDTSESEVVTNYKDNIPY